MTEGTSTFTLGCLSIAQKTYKIVTIDTKIKCSCWSFKRESWVSEYFSWGSPSMDEMLSLQSNHQSYLLQYTYLK